MFRLALFFYAMQSVDRQQYLTDLVCLGFSLFFLNIDARIAGPGRLEDGMAGSALPRLAKIRSRKP